MSRRGFLMAALIGLVVVLVAGSPLCAADFGERETQVIPPPGTGRFAAKPGKTTLGGQSNKKPGDGWWTTLGGLTAVVALIFLTAKVLRKSVPPAQKTLPAEVVQVLGRKPLDYRHTVHLVRFGSRLLMLGASPEGLATLSEITDPVEIDYLAGLCRPSRPASVTQSFTHFFRKFQNADETGPDDSIESEAGPGSDPAVLRLQERLHLSDHPDHDDATGPVSREAAQ